MHSASPDPRVFSFRRLPARRCAALLAIILSLSCNRATPLSGSEPTLQALAQTVLAALEKRNLAALRAAALSEQEFKEHVWPELPAARPERNLPFSYVWGDLHQKSEAGLSRTLAELGGQRYELVGVRFLGDTTPYTTFVVHRKTEVTVKDATGAQMPLRLFGSVLEKGGQFKVFSYVQD